jgi:GntR family transcriptional regulator, transcriptional repressor for pyruvate dehydrogenase complex
LEGVLRSASADAETAAVPVLGHKVLRPRQQVENTLRKAVLSGQLVTGQRLPAETELARQFSVSRPTIREVLSALETQGLIRKIPGAGGGSFVQTVDHTALGRVVQESVHNVLRLGCVSFDEVAIVRQYLEVPSVILAAAHRTEEDLVELRQIVREQRASGLFHGVIAATTPMGSRIVKACIFGTLTARVSPSGLSATPAKK